jgi:hypothetical protein
MKNWLYALASILLGFGGGIVFSHPISLPIGYLLFSIGGITLICLLIAELSNKLWPSKLNWEYRFEQGERVFRQWYNVFQFGESHVNWDSNIPQNNSMTYTLDIKKNRVISEFNFWNGSKNNFPEKWNVTFYNSHHHIMSPFKNKLKLGLSGNGIIMAKLETPVKTQFIQVDILEANPHFRWEIEDIFLVENRFLGKYWKKVIEK